MKWKELAPDLKMCVTVYREGLEGKKVWRSRLVELLRDDCTKLEISKNEDKLFDLGILSSHYEKVDGLWTSCLQIESEALSFIKNVAENVS